MNPLDRLRSLREQWTGCTNCGLSKLRKDPTIVFGSGSASANFLIVTEAPTQEDVDTGVPLSGEDGDFVNSVLRNCGISQEDTFRTTTVACRPYVVLPATEETQETVRSRSPQLDEVNACKPRLKAIIYAVDPRIIIAMGDIPWKTLVTTKDRGHMKNVVQAAGTLFETWVEGRVRPVRYPVIAVMSPEQVAANPSTAQHGPIVTTLEAVRRAATYVNWLKKEEQTDE